MRWLGALSLMNLILGCGTTARHETPVVQTQAPPPSAWIETWSNATLEQLEKLKLEETDQRNLWWWKTYRLGQFYAEKKSPRACEQFLTLAQDISFPLNDLAVLRTHETCPADRRPALPKEVSAWYRELFIDIKLAENEDLPTLLEKARLESNLRKKEVLLMKACEKAKASGNAATISATEKLLYKVTPRLLPQPDPHELNAVAQDFRAHREFEKAIAVYKKIINSPENSVDEKFFALKGLRQTYKIMERKNDYIAATTDLLNWTKQRFEKHKRDFRSVQRFHDAQILLAKTLWTEQQTSQAVRILNETQRQLKGRYPMDEVYFILSRIEEEKGHFDKALEYSEGSYKERVSQASLRDKTLWLKAWINFKIKKYPEATAAFQQMKEKVKDPSDKARASFWLSRCLQNQRQTEMAQQERLWLSQNDPLGYYGLLAYREMKISMPPLKFEKSEELNLSLLSLNEIAPKQKMAAEWLIALGEKSFAEKNLNAIFDDLKKRNITRDQTWLVVTSSYARAGLYLPLFSALGNLNPSVKDDLMKAHPDLLFPLPYQDLVKQAEVQSGTPAAFMYSIIRQESAFNPEARSPVDALGLMQLLPSVAKKIAQSKKLPYSEADDLFKPEVNIPLGAFELKTLMSKYKDQFVLATAAYNASGRAIKGWLNNRGREDVVEFIEEIPYEETRTYIKLVMRNYAFYERLLNKNQATPFPERLLYFAGLQKASAPEGSLEKAQSETGSTAE